MSNAWDSFVKSDHHAKNAESNTNIVFIILILISWAHQGDSKHQKQEKMEQNIMHIFCIIKTTFPKKTHDKYNKFQE